MKNSGPESNEGLAILARILARIHISKTLDTYLTLRDDKPQNEEIIIEEESVV
jgi:hypothetical protein